METRYQILIVDNDPRICRLIQRYLEQEGYRLDTATSLKEMLRKLTEVKIDLILLDAQIPEKASFTLANELSAFPNVQIILVTDNVDARANVLGLEFGADDYVKKPLNEMELLARVRRVLRRGSTKGLLSPT